MFGFKGFPPPGIAGVKFLAIAPTIGLLWACGGDHSVSPTGATSDASAPQAADAVASTLAVQTTPELIPTFDPSVHDYVINCTSTSEVQFSAQTGHPGYFGFFGPGEPGTQPGALPFGSIQESFPMAPNERFRFMDGRDGDEYSVRCLPRDFPPLTVSVTGTPQAQ